MANRFINPNPQFLKNDGTVNSGGTLTFYLTGTTTLASTWLDSTLATAGSNPLLLDSAGRMTEDVFLSPSITYKVVLKDSSGSTIWTEDPVVDPAANVTAAIQVYPGNPNGNVAGNQGVQGGVGASMVYDITNNLLYVCTTTGTATTAVWTQVGASLAGAITETGVVSPTALSANTDNWDPSATAASHILQDVTADVDVTGMAGGVAGAVKTIHNTSTTGKRIRFVDETYSTASTAANRFKFGGRDQFLYPGEAIKLWWSSTDSRWRLNEAAHNHIMGVSGFRLSLATATPVHSADITAIATVFYTPYVGNVATLWNGSSFYTEQFSEVSQALSDATKSPAAAAINSVYDMFLWNDAGTIRCTRGPAWSSATSRGTGAGTTELERVNGVLMNKVAITNGPAANRGIYVGTIATDGSTQMAMNMNPAAAAGGTNNRLDVWNMYNRVDVSAICRPSDDTWTYTIATWRSVNASTSNRITMVRGLDEDAVTVNAKATFGNGGTVTARTGIGLDVTNAFSGLPGTLRPTTSDENTVIAQYRGLPGIGRHFFQWLEYSEAAGTTVWQGDNGSPTTQQNGLLLSSRM